MVVVVIYVEVGCRCGISSCGSNCGLSSCDSRRGVSSSGSSCGITNCGSSLGISSCGSCGISSIIQYYARCVIVVIFIRYY